MIPLALGLGVLALLLTAAGAFARARVETVKAVLAWIAALAGLSLVGMLFLTGKGPAALSGLVLAGPLVWRFWKENQPRMAQGGTGGGASASFGGRMGRKEALAVLGLAEGASESDIRAAWVRLMRVVHPDGGGTDWLASRVNQAKDVLLRR
jgi:hypothetical protein